MNEDENNQDIDLSGINPYSNPMNNMGSNILLLTDPSNELYQLELDFRGLETDADGKLKQVTDEMLNEVGIKRVMSLIRSLVKRSTHMSNFTEKEISPVMIDFVDALSLDLMVHGRAKYGVKDNATKKTITRIAENHAFISLKRGMQEGERRFLKGSQQEITMRSEKGSKEAGNTLTRALGWRK